MVLSVSGRVLAKLVGCIQFTQGLYEGPFGRVTLINALPSRKATSENCPMDREQERAQHSQAHHSIGSAVHQLSPRQAAGTVFLAVTAGSTL